MRNGFRRFQEVLTVLLISAVASSMMLYAQGTSGNISGQVLDPSRSAIPAVKLIATSLATNVATTGTTTETGNYNLVVPPDVYRLTAEGAGFKTYVQNNVTVTASASVRVDITLEVGAIAETVEVKGTVLAVQSDNAKISTAVENTFVDALPLVVSGALRSPYDLVGVAGQVMSSGTTEMSLGGAQARSWNATLDGLSITTNRSAEKFEVAYGAPSVEAITELSVDTGGFKAEYGQAMGGIITFSSKSGTNDFHGTAYDFLRNQVLDARRFFEAQKTVYKQNDFGAAAGGHLSIPKLYNGKDRTFYYLTYEGFRNRTGSTPSIYSVPTPEMYNGDFSKWVNQSNQLLQIYDPATTRSNAAGGFVRDPFPNNQIPKTRFSSISQKIVPYAQPVLLPNRGGQPGTSAYVRNNYLNAATGSIQSPQDKGSFKIDHVITDKHRLSYFYNITRYRDTVGADGPPGLPPPLYGGMLFKWDGSSDRIIYNWIVSPTKVNVLSFGWNLFWRPQVSLNYGLNWKDKVCIPNVIDCNKNFPYVSFTEFSTWGANAESGMEAPSVLLKDDFSYVHNKHTIKAGFAYQLQKSTGTGEQTIAGQATFSYLGTGVPGDTSFRSGSSFASFLLGDAQTGMTESVRDNTFVYPYWAGYVQDDWRVARNLTINFGLRYELTQSPTVDNNWFSNFDPTLPNPAANNYPGALQFAGFGPGTQNSRTLAPGWHKGLGPRLGLAYSPNTKTSLRAAFGRSFGRVMPNRDSGHYQGFIGRYNFSSSDNGITPAFNWDVGLPAYPLPLSMTGKGTPDPSFANNDEVHYFNGLDASRAPESLTWTIGIQRELSNNSVLEATYSGNVGTHLTSSLLNMNQVPTSVWNSYVQKYGATNARNILQSDINSALARSANVPIPYANFVDPKYQLSRTVNQALRPFPQYLFVVTGVRGNGDRSGHSSYHALLLKFTRRYSNGLTFEWNYTLSKLLTDTDNQVEGNGDTQDQYNRRTEKSIGGYDQTHVLKFNTVYELPVGRGKRFLGKSPAFVNAILGGWRIAGIASYASAFPIQLTRNNPLPIFNGSTRPTITSYDNWRAPLKGSRFDPAVDLFMNPAAFPAQPIDFGNATRANPKLRGFPFLNENVSMAKTFKFNEKYSLNVRWEAFNLLNRVVFDATTSTNLNSATFGVITAQQNDPRRMQVGLKMYW